MWKHIKEQKKVIPYGRLLSDLFYQIRLIQVLEDTQSKEDLGITNGKAFDSQTLVKMGVRSNVMW